MTFVPVVEYRYQFGAAVYTGSENGFSEVGYGSRRTAEKMLARYPAGTGVDVHYNAASSAETFLESSVVLAWIRLAAGASILGVAVVLGIYGI